MWMILGFCCCHMSLRAQDTTRVDLKLSRVTLDVVFQKIEQLTGYVFVYNAEDVRGVPLLDVNEKRASVQDVLARCLKNTGLIYEFKKNAIVIRKQLSVQPDRGIRIHGRVTDESREPLPGVTVRVKDVPVGTATNLAGEYTITVPEGRGRPVLVFTFVGMTTREVNYSGDNEINVTLREELAKIDEVVVTGMFTRRAESFTGAATTFKKEDILRVGNQNLIRSLKNLDPAFQIMENLEFGSDPNRMPNVQLRGQSSFPSLQGEYENNPNQPLFILDGFETTLEKIYDLDMNRVATVTLLKDAAAKAIYGSKAGNGVVVIETINPKSGELRVYYSGNFGLEAPDLTGYNLMNAAEKLDYEVRIGMYGPATSDGVITAYDAYKKVYDDIVRGVDTYWLAKPLHVGFSSKHSLTLEGGDGKIRYQLGVSYNSVSGVMKGSDRNTLNANTTLSYTYKNLLFRNTIEFTRNWAVNSPYGSFSEYTSLNPYWAPYDEQGNLIRKFTVHTGEGEGSYYERSVYNPLYNATLNTKDESQYTEVRDNFSVDWRVSEAFRVVGKFGYTRRDGGSDLFYPGSHTKFINYDANGMSDRKGNYTKKDDAQESVSLQAGINFSKNYGRHLLFANLTWNLFTNTSKSTKVTAEGFGNDYMDDISFATKYEKNGKPGGGNSRLREIGIIGAVNYSYADRYLFDASLRKSASSAYGRDSHWGTFWSLGVGWNLHHERFLEDNEWIRNLKLRASVGYTGTQNLDPSQSRARYEYYDYTYSDKIGAQLVAIPNNKLQWQRNMDYNFGADVTLKEVLTLRADYYIQRTEDLLSDISIPPSTGFLKYMENLGVIENRGYEVALQLTPWQDRGKRAYVSFSVTALHNDNKIKKIYDIFKNSNEEQNSSLDSGIDSDETAIDSPEVVSKYLNKYTKPATLYYEGCSMTAIWGVRSLGIDPARGQEMFLKKDGRSTFSWSSADQVVIGDTSPKVSGTLGLNAGYKGFSMSVSCSYKLGGDLYNNALIGRVENVTGRDNLDKRILQAWQKAGDVAPYRVTIVDSYLMGYTRPTSRFVQKNNELYVSSVNVGYDFPKDSWIKKIALQRLKITFYMNELVRWSSVDIERGTSYPFARNFSLAVLATF